MSQARTKRETITPTGAALLELVGFDPSHLLDDGRSQREAVILIMVGNGADTALQGLDSLTHHTRSARLIALADGSTAPKVLDDLTRRADAGEIELVRHDGPSPDPIAYSLGLATDSDVVLIQGTTEVGPGWLEGLQRVARSRSGVGTVSALLDGAADPGPESGVSGSGWPGHLSWSEVARAVMRSGLPLSAEIVTCDADCLLVTREAIDAVAALHPPLRPGLTTGAGLRSVLIEAGLVNLLAPRVLVRRGPAGVLSPMATPRLGVETRAGLHSRLQEIPQELAVQIDVPPRRLYVTYRGETGAEAETHGLMRKLASYQDSYLLESIDAQGLELSRVSRTAREHLATWTTAEPYAATDSWRADYADVVARLMINLGIELVHIEHLVGHPLTTLALVARRLGIPVAVTTHDFFLSCPNTHAPGDHEPPCAAQCPVGGVAAGSAESGEAGASPTRDLWHERVDTLLEASDAVLVPSRSSARALVSSHPRHKVAIRVIEPGCDLAGTPTLRRNVLRAPGPLRILAMADWNVHRGTNYLRAVARDLGALVEWHVLGQGSDSLADVAVAHGVYRRGVLRRLVAEIDPDLAAVFSLRPEPYSHALMDSWAMGIPVLATDTAQAAEEIRAHGGGLVLPSTDPQAAARDIAALAADAHALRTLRWQVPRLVPRPPTATAEAYRTLYDQLESRPLDRCRIGYMVQGELGAHGSCEHIRILRRISNTSVSDRTSWQHVFGSDIGIARGLSDLDVLFLQRDGAGQYTDAVLEAVRGSGVRLVVEMDDALLHVEAADRMGITLEQHRPLRERLATLLKAADGLVVSTEVLGSQLRDLTLAEPVVIHNELDPRIWLSEITPVRSPKTKELRVLYMGTKTHHEDLLLLRPVLEPVAEALGQVLILEVIGVTGNPDDDNWVRRLDPGPQCSNYPDFVRWLRARGSRWDAAVAPLVDTEFNRAKSDLKLLEYALLGVPVVASDVGPYRGAERLATLTPNNDASWISALSGLLADPKTAADQARRARKHTLTHRMITSEGVENWLSIITGRTAGTSQGERTTSRRLRP